MNIKIGKTNDIVLTLNERVTLINPFYLFHFISKFNSSEERLFYCDNISIKKIRYDEFEIIETNTPDYLDNQVDLFSGEWKYIVYETDALDFVTENKNVLETGLLIVTED